MFRKNDAPEPPKAVAPRVIADYPKAVYKDRETRIVQTEAEHQALGKGWI